MGKVKRPVETICLGNESSISFLFIFKDSAISSIFNSISLIIGFDCIIKTFSHTPSFKKISTDKIPAFVS